jgi:hypothetical protein
VQRAADDLDVASLVVHRQGQARGAGADVARDPDGDAVGAGGEARDALVGEAVLALLAITDAIVLSSKNSCDVNS